MGSRQFEPGQGRPGSSRGDINNMRDDDQSACPPHIAKWRADHEIRVSGGCPDPFLDFENALPGGMISQEIQRAGFDKPSLIQSQAWPAAISGRDVVGVARTGSGKTLGFLLPGFNNILNTPAHLRKNPRGGPRCVPIIV